MMRNQALFIKLSLALSMFTGLLLSLSAVAIDSPNPQIKAVNLGGWLVTEGWIKPSLFDGISNKDLLDGTQVQFRSVKQNKYIAAENGEGTTIVANRASPSGWETFKAKMESSVMADFQGGTNWGDNSPSVFVMTIVGTMQGESQITNGYGQEQAVTVMTQHWASFITEEDFQFISSNGLNAVRIPVGRWIASDPSLLWPYVGGSLAALDNAFTWAEKYGVKVLIDLHAAPGSQNGNDHSASRDGSQEWGNSEQNIKQTVNVIDFLASRYANRPGLLAVELINEPLVPGVTLDSLTKYYSAGYNTVRKYTQSAYVIMSNRLGPADPKELFSVAGGLSRVIIDVHYYNLSTSEFDNMSVQQNIDYIYNKRASQLGAITTSNRPLTFVGEWVAEWKVNGASDYDYRGFANAELDVFGRASFGWAYWSIKNRNNPQWSMKWMINHGIIKL